VVFSPASGGEQERWRFNTGGPASVTIASGNVGGIDEEDAMFKFREDGSKATCASHRE
jgi:hypothetical protein